MTPQVDDLNHDDSAVDVTDDREACPRFWIAAYTRPRSEKKAAAELAGKVEVYVPVQTVEKQWSDRRKKVDVVVIPMVIFVKITKEDIPTVRDHILIRRILSLPGRKEPAAIPDDQIENLKLMLTKADTPIEFVENKFNLSDSVKVTKGRLAGLVGKVERIDGKRSRLIVSIDMLGGAMVEIDTKDLEIILTT